MLANGPATLPSRGETEDEFLKQAVEHAQSARGMTEFPPVVVANTRPARRNA
ncbi:MAG: DUF1059 domain-containing protein [Alphaproteobacteria bacterium]